jgi:putative salt-induced outer membrane protein
MPTKFCKTALTAGLFCLPMLTSTALAEVTPEQYTLLMTAANKDGGKNFNILVDLLIAAHPEDAVEIRRVAEDMKPAPPVQPSTPKAAPITAAEGTIFSDQGAKQLSESFLPGWEKEIEVNLLYSTGNTEQRSFGTGTKFVREAGQFRQEVTTYFDYNNSNNVTNKRRYGIAFKNDYSINDKSYITGFASFEGDSFGAFNKRFTLNAGYGLRLLDNDKFKWNMETGPAMLLTKPVATEGYETTLAAFASNIFSWVINDRSEFSNESKIFMGNILVIENKTDYKLQISGALSGKLSFDVLYNRDAPIDRAKTDTITRIGVLYDF